MAGGGRVPLGVTVALLGGWTWPKVFGCLGAWAPGDGDDPGGLDSDDPGVCGSGRQVIGRRGRRRRAGSGRRRWRCELVSGLG